MFHRVDPNFKDIKSLECVIFHNIKFEENFKEPILDNLNQISFYDCVLGKKFDFSTMMFSKFYECLKILNLKNCEIQKLDENLKVFNSLKKFTIENCKISDKHLLSLI